MTLWSEFLTNTGRPIHKWVHYFPVYERHFRPLVDRTVTFVEIGVFQGGSLQLWKRYLGPFARIIGIDIDPKCKAFEDEQISVRIGNQSDVGFLQSVLDEFGSPDVVLDDGSHMMTDISSSFEYLYPRLDKNGIYMIEDLHTAYWGEYEGGLGEQRSFVEKCKGLIDELNAEHSRGSVPISEFTQITRSMHFYDSIAVFERGRHTTKFAPIIGQS